MKKISLVFISVFFVSYLFSINNYPDNFFFTTLNTESGLSQNKVNAIFQDSDGFMWFGTSNQLNRYDGISVKVFDCYDKIRGKGDKNIAVLAEDDKHKLWIGTGTGIFVYDPEKDIFTFFEGKTEGGVQIQTWISDIQTDKDSNVWITAPAQGIFRFNAGNNSLHHYTLTEDYYSNRDFSVQCICVEENGTVWIGTKREGLFLYNNVSDSFTHYPVDSDGKVSDSNSIFKLCEYGKYLVIGIHDGCLKTFNKYTRQLEESYLSGLEFDVVREIKSFNNEDLWVGTESGLYIINEVDRYSIHIEQDLMNPKTLADNKISSIYKDKEDGIWIGTFFGGVCYLANKSVKFENYIPLSRKNSVRSKRIKEIKEDVSGHIWIATEDAGIDILDPVLKEFRTIEALTGFKLKSNNVTSLFIDKDKIRIGFFQPGFDIINLPGCQLHHYSGAETGTKDESIYSFYRDTKGNLWMGTLWSLYVLSEDQYSFREIESLRGNFIFDILEDKENFIWIATLGQGIFRLNPETGTSEHFFIGDDSGLLSNTVSSITEDGRGQLWFATDGGGICMFDRLNGKFISYTMNDGLPDNTACKILEDNNRSLWFGTTKGLVRLDPQTKEIKVFTVNDGLPGNQFSYKSALRSRSGEFYFGGVEGLVRLNPYRIEINDYVPPVFITQLAVSNKVVEPHSEDSLIRQAIDYTKGIILQHDQSTISFEFAALSFTASRANKYAYMMEKIDADWIYVNNIHTASYTKLSPGKYIFRVKGSNNDGIWNEQGAFLEITVLPPWWRSDLAYTSYLVLFAGLVFFIVRYYMRRNEKKTRERLHLFEVQKEKELYRNKIDFFTNLAHEIRTPLTLINGPLEFIQEMKIENAELKKNLNIINENADHLSRLISQLLDFRKVEGDKLHLNYSNENINQLLKKLELRFSMLIRQKNKIIESDMPEEDIIASVDSDALNKIMNNLFSNAIKYSDKKIQIKLRRSDEYFEIIVSSDGELIPEGYQERIFEPFFRISGDAIPGSGIGLSIARSLTELMNGNLNVKLENGLNVFILKLLLKQQELISARPETVHPDSIIIEENEFRSSKKQSYTILLVEDNVDMLSFLEDRLSVFFSVEKAINGSNALEVLNEKSIDLIISDVMMDKMDGLELCRMVKNNMELSHISVILLTAKNDLNSKIQGLEAGADAYIEKPFTFSYLKAQISTLLENRLRERKAFLQNPLLSVSQVGMNKADEIFMNRLIDLIHENIQDYSFNVEKLAGFLSISRSNLHRKIKILTDMAPVDFIRLIRLKKAAELIRTGEYRIGDICFMVGIQSQAYFSKLFREQFGVTPKEFEKQPGI